MRKILAIALVLISANCFAQARESGPPTKPSAGWVSHTPGYELRKAGWMFYTGLGLEVGGGIFISFGSAEYSASYQNNHNTTAGSGDIVLGTLMITTGVVYQTLAWIHVIRAGKLMDAAKVSFGPTQYGLGITCKF